MINHMNLTCWDATDRRVANLRSSNVSSFLLEQISVAITKLESRLDAADLRVAAIQASRQPDYMEWQQPLAHNQYVAARSWQQDRASFYQPDRYPPQPDPDPPDNTTTYGPPGIPQPTLSGPSSYAQPRSSHAAHHAHQGDVQQPRNYPNGPDPYAQPRYSTAGFHPWQTRDPYPQPHSGPPQHPPYFGRDSYVQQ